jgi:hypothetical protein
MSDRQRPIRNGISSGSAPSVGNKKMSGDTANLIGTLVDEEVRRIVADAIRERGCLSVSAAAAQILKTYPQCGLNERELVNSLAMAAARSGVAVELGRGRSA